MFRMRFVALHSNFSDFFVNFVNSLAIFEKSAMNFLQYPAKPMKDCMSLTFFGVGNSFIAVNFEGFGDIPFSEIIWPK